MALGDTEGPLSTLSHYPGNEAARVRGRGAAESNRTLQRHLYRAKQLVFENLLAPLVTYPTINVVR